MNNQLISCRQVEESLLKMIQLYITFSWSFDDIQGHLYTTSDVLIGDIGVPKTHACVGIKSIIPITWVNKGKMMNHYPA